MIIRELFFLDWLNRRGVTLNKGTYRKYIQFTAPEIPYPPVHTIAVVRTALVGIAFNSFESVGAGTDDDAGMNPVMG